MLIASIRVVSTSLDPGNSRTVLIVEDEESIRQVLQMMLELENFHVLVAANGREAITQLAESATAPDLILLDLMMPVMNGWEFVDAIRKDGKFSSIPIIVVTAFRDKAETIKADDIIFKPIDFDVLVQTIQKYFAPKKMSA